jgi:Holliday junction resolvase-like predicted endonuclease
LQAETQAAGAITTPSPTPLAAVGQPQEVDDLIIPKGKVMDGGKAGGVGYRRSKRAKEIGDWAEDLVVEFLKTQGGCADIVHRAAVFETPGWDIDYRDEHGVLHRVEVKGTVGGAFSAIDLTANELRAAQQHRSEYWIFLVANCLTDHPRIQRICGPADKLAAGAWVATPALYSVSLG